MNSIGVVGRFETADDLIAAVQSARAAGFEQFEAYAPFPVPGLARAIGFRERLIPRLALLAGVIAAALGYFMQWYAGVIDYPFVVGGKPLHSWPAFLLITFELGILAAVVVTVLAMLAANRLPQPYHPIFDWPVFERASSDGFFLMIEHDDTTTITRFMQEHKAVELKALTQ